VPALMHASMRAASMARCSGTQKVVVSSTLRVDPGGRPNSAHACADHQVARDGRSISQPAKEAAASALAAAAAPAWPGTACSRIAVFIIEWFILYAHRHSGGRKIRFIGPPRKTTIQVFLIQWRIRQLRIRYAETGALHIGAGRKLSR
jgi:hypothetical protein